MQGRRSFNIILGPVVAALCANSSCEDSAESKPAPADSNTRPTKNIDIEKLCEFGEHLGDNMTAGASFVSTIDQPALDARERLMPSLIYAEVCPEKNRRMWENGGPLPIGARVAVFTALYRDSQAVFSVTQFPDGRSMDIDQEIESNSVVIIDKVFSISRGTNFREEQQVEFNDERYVPHFSVLYDNTDGTSICVYSYRGWWDNQTTIRMDVLLQDPVIGEKNYVPDLYPALPLWDTAIRLLEGRQLVMVMCGPLSHHH